MYHIALGTSSCYLVHKQPQLMYLRACIRHSEVGPIIHYGVHHELAYNFEEITPSTSFLHPLMPVNLVHHPVLFRYPETFSNFSSGLKLNSIFVLFTTEE